MTARNHLYFWAGTFALFLTVVWLLGDILLPFVLGIAIAYLLNPLVEGLEKWKISRRLSALMILSLFFVSLSTILILIIPVACREIIQLANAAPGYLENLWLFLTPHLGWLHNKIGNGNLDGFQNAIQNNAGNALKAGGGVLSGLAGLAGSSGQALAGFLSLILLTPVVAYFMMKEWTHITNWLDQQLPRRSRNTIRDLAKQIDGKLAGFVRGQMSIAFSLAIIYAIALTIAGLKFGFLIGLGAGILSIIPLVGATLGLVVSISVAWFQTGVWSYVAIIATIFIVGQIIESNILTPKLLGDSVGLHPLWILFALMAGGSLFGIVGMLLGVPVVAVIGVLAAFSIQQYRNSPYFQPLKSGEKPKTKYKKKDKKIKNIKAKSNKKIKA